MIDSTAVTPTIWVEKPVELVGDPRTTVRVIRNHRPIRLDDVVRMDAAYDDEVDIIRSMDALGEAVGRLVIKRVPVASERTRIELVVRCILRSLHIGFATVHAGQSVTFNLLRTEKAAEPVELAYETAITRLLDTAVHTVGDPKRIIFRMHLNRPGSSIAICH